MKHARSWIRGGTRASEITQKSAVLHTRLVSTWVGLNNQPEKSEPPGESGNRKQHCPRGEKIHHRNNHKIDRCDPTSNTKNQTHFLSAPLFYFSPCLLSAIFRLVPSMPVTTLEAFTATTMLLLAAALGLALASTSPSLPQRLLPFHQQLNLASNWTPRACSSVSMEVWMVSAPFLVCNNVILLLQRWKDDEREVSRPLPFSGTIYPNASICLPLQQSLLCIQFISNRSINLWTSPFAFRSLALFWQYFCETPTIRFWILRFDVPRN